MQFLIIMALMLGVMYVLMIRPQRQKQAQQQSMIEEAGVGDDVLTTGGIYGTITEVEGDDVVVEIAHGITVHMTRRGIAAVLPPEQEEEEHEDAESMRQRALEEAEAELDEASVRTQEDSVTSEPDVGTAAGDRR